MVRSKGFLMVAISLEGADFRNTRQRTPMTAIARAIMFMPWRQPDAK